jgi:hypothetical protein
MLHELEMLQRRRAQLYQQILQQAELHLVHNVQECRSRRNEGNRWFFRRGMEQGIDSGLRYYFENYLSFSEDPRPLAQILIEHKKTVIETCELTPYKAIINWGLTELEDILDVEREDVVCGIQHGLCAVAHNLPRLIKTSENKKAPLRRPLQSVIK